MSVLGSAGSYAWYPGEQPGYLVTQSSALAAPAPVSGAPIVASTGVQPSGTVDACPVVIERHQTTIGGRFTGTAVAPHVTTERFRYTVPAGRAAYMQSLASLIARITAGAPNDNADSLILVTPAHGAAFSALHRWLRLGAGVGDADMEVAPSNILLTEGDIVAIFTHDASTGGTLTWDVSCSLREFDWP